MDLPDRSVAAVGTHISEADSRERIMGLVAGDAAFGGDPDGPVAILENRLNRIVRQPVFPRQGLEDAAIVAADATAKGAEPQMPLPIFQDT